MLVTMYSGSGVVYPSSRSVSVVQLGRMCKGSCDR